MKSVRINDPWSIPHLLGAVGALGRYRFIERKPEADPVSLLSRVQGPTTFDGDGVCGDMDANPHDYYQS